jgi:hypothetical protein
MSESVFCPFCEKEYKVRELELYEDCDEVEINCSCEGDFRVTLELMKEYDVTQLKLPPKEKMEELGLMDDCPGQLYLFDGIS